MAWLLPQRGKPLCTQIASRERDVRTTLYLSGDRDRMTLESTICTYVFAFEGVLHKLALCLVPKFIVSESLPSVLGPEVPVCETPPSQISDVTLPAIFIKVCQIP